MLNSEHVNFHSADSLSVEVELMGNRHLCAQNSFALVCSSSEETYDVLTGRRFVNTVDYRSQNKRNFKEVNIGVSLLGAKWGIH
jgi:hypothetical protein